MVSDVASSIQTFSDENSPVNEEGGSLYVVPTYLESFINVDDPDVEKQQTFTSNMYSDPEQRPPVFKSAIQEYLSVFFCIFGPAAASMASSSYQLLLGATAEHFNVEGGKLTWSVSSVMLANGSCLLLMGGVADAFGRKNAMMIGFFSYAIFALIGGFMDNYILLCLFRGFQGACVACATPASAGFLGSTYKDSKRKNMVMSCFGIGAPVGGACGFFIAGVCVVAINWRSCQFFLAIVYGLITVGVYFTIPSDKKLDKQHIKSVFKKLDYGGAFISLASFTLICFSLTQVDATTEKWKTPYIIALLIVGVFLIGCFIIYEHFIPVQPLMPLKLFENRNVILSMIIASFSWMTFFGVLNYNAVMYFEKIRGYSAIITACCFLTQPIAGILVNIFAGFTMHKIPGRILMSVGALGFTIASIIWATMSTSRNYFTGPFWAFIFTVIGADLIYNIANRATLSSLPRELQSRGAGTFNTILQLSSSVALGFTSTIISSKYSKYGKPDQDDYPNEFFAAMKYTYYFGIALAGSAFILSLFLKIGVIGVKNDEKLEDVKLSTTENKFLKQ